jgi:hypothetical protein
VFNIQATDFRKNSGGKLTASVLTVTKAATAIIERQREYRNGDYLQQKQADIFP